MKNYWLKIFVISVILFAVGTAMHFEIQLLGKNTITSAIFPVNESLFQHLKLGVYPLLTFWLVYGSVQKLRGKPINNISLAAAISSLVFIALTITFFYTYTGLTGSHILFLDILGMFVEIMYALYVGFNITQFNNKIIFNILSYFLIALIVFCLIYFTFFPLPLPIFV